MNTALMTLTTAVFIAMSSKTYHRDSDTGNVSGNSKPASYEKNIYVPGSNDPLCDTTYNIIPSSTTADITDKEGNTY